MTAPGATVVRSRTARGGVLHAEMWWFRAGVPTAYLEGDEQALVLGATPAIVPLRVRYHSTEPPMHAAVTVEETAPLALAPADAERAFAEPSD